MTESEPDESDDEQTSDALTLDVNGKRFALNDEFRRAVQKRARLEFEPNEMFSSWWRRGTAEDEHHDEGDPVLVIETRGPMVPWENLDEMDVEMEEPEGDGNPYADGDTQDVDAGNGMKTVPRDDAPAAEDDEEEKGRSHFMWTPQQYEEVPQPEGEEPDEIPPKPVEMGEDPDLVYWIPSHPDRNECWSAGEALVPCESWVEWNVQSKADDMRLTHDGEKKANSHDHWESICSIHDCEQVGEYQAKQNVPPRQDDDTPGSVERKGEDAFSDGRYGGGHWQV